MDKRNLIVQRAASEVKSGMYVNLGIGMPTLVADFISKSVENVLFQAENGMLGIGPYPYPNEVDPDLTNASKETVSCLPGGSFFDSAESFGMIRGGHIDLAILGGMEVSQEGDLANWMVPKKLVKGMGGAMDLVSGAKKVIIVMEHTNKDGISKVKNTCTLPLTGQRVVDLLITELGVFEFKKGKMYLIELQPNVDINYLKSKTEAEFTVSI